LRTLWRIPLEGILGRNYERVSSKVPLQKFPRGELQVCTLGIPSQILGVLRVFFNMSSKVFLSMLQLFINFDKL
jgi:hypothetical protein